MLYSFKRALGIALAMYITSMVVGVIAGLIAGFDMASMEGIPDSFWYVGMVLSVILMALFTLWYFGNQNLKRTAVTGLYFGLTAFAVSFILDLLFFALGSSQGVDTDLSGYYGDVRFWITVALAVLTATSVGVLKSSKPTVSTIPPTSPNV